MQLGMIGLGRMGAGMSRRLLGAGHQVAVFDLSPAKAAALAGDGARPSGSLEELAAALEPPRAVWMMLPAGQAVDQTLEALAPHLQRGDAVVDGGNSYYRDSVRRARRLEERGLHFLDVGVSGGVWGLEEGFCLMAGGPEEAYRRLEPALRDLAPPGGYARVGASGAGHFVKMVHNGIEYGLMEAYSEGFSILEAKKEYGLDLVGIGELWRHGSVIRSWLLDLATRALAADPRLEEVAPYVEDSGEGRWTVFESIDLNIPIPIISLALQVRLRSREDRPLAMRLVAALRRQFGGHAVRQAQPR